MYKLLEDTKIMMNDRVFLSKTVKIAFPVAMQGMLNTVVNMIDTMMIGSLGATAIAAVGLANKVFFVMTLLVFGVVSGSGILAAQFWGNQDVKSIRKVLGLALVLAAGAALAFFLPAVLCPRAVMRIFTTGEETIRIGASYLVLAAFSYPFIAVSNTYVAMLRAVGQVKAPVVISSVAILINIALNYTLIFGKFGAPALGVRGAAIATVISRFVECAIVLIHTHRRAQEHPFVLGLYATLKVPASLMIKIITKGMPLLLNETLWAAGTAMLTQCYSVRGLNVIAALNISNTINNVFNIVFIALGESVAIIVGQLLGAGKMDEARDTDNKMIAFSVFSCVLIAIVMLLLAQFFPLLYNTNDEAKKLATYFIMLTAVFMPQNAFLHASYFTLRSGGKTIITFLFDSVFIWCVSVVIAFTLSRFTALPVVAVYAFVQMGDWIKCVIGFVLVKKGIWLQNIVS